MRLPTLPVVLQVMDAAERAARSNNSTRSAAKAFRRDLSRRGMGSITWGTRSMQLRGMGFITAQGDTGDFNTAMGPAIMPQPFPGNPDTMPGAWPGLNPALNPSMSPANPAPGVILNPPITSPMQANGGPAQVPVIVTPTSGPIPSPATVAAAAAAHVSWLEQSMIGGIANKWLLLGGIAALFVFGGKK